MNDRITTVPQLFELYKQDPLRAVLVADRWSKSTELELYDAAWEINAQQTVLPRCANCQWAILENEPHGYCEQRLQEKEDARVRDSIPRPTHPSNAWNLG